MKSDTIERRVARFSRRCAKLILELRELGDRDGAARFEALAIQLVDDMRRGRA